MERAQAEVLHVHDAPPADVERALDRILQLSYVSRPVVLLQRQSCGRRKHRRLPVQSRSSRQEFEGQREDIFRTLPERRKEEHEHREPVIEIGPKRSRRDDRIELGVRGSDEPHVHAPLRGRSQRAEASILDDAQEGDLGAGGEGVDLVQEERPPGGVSQETLLWRARVRGAPFVAEQLVLEQGVHEGVAVHGDEWMRGSRTQAVDRPRDQLLARPRLTRDQHGSIRSRERGDLCHSLHEARSVSDETGQHSPVAFRSGCGFGGSLRGGAEVERRGSL